MNNKNIFVRMATLGPIGYLPAPGTMATIATLPLVYFLFWLNMSHQFHILLVVLITMTSFKIVGRALDQFKVRDPSEIVLDELVGCLVTFCCIPISFFSLALGFVAFRLFDIFKPLGLSKTELLYGSLGVVIDDVLAGLFAHVVVRAVLYYW
ncbi:phosphatidylglycerophosphatase A [Candidatus Dependentiae bacterium]